MFKAGIHFDISNEEYHNPEVFSVSSSQLKKMLEDPEIFYRSYITKELPKAESSAFDTGSYYHCAILEPDKLDTEFILYEGKVRAGKVWEEFKEANKGKCIVINSNLKDADILITSTKASKIAMGLISNGKAEVSCYVELWVDGNDIYTTDKKRLTLDGWVDVEVLPKHPTKLFVRVRADWLGETYIVDLKSTNGNTKRANEISKKIHDFDYDMSAAFYLDIFNAIDNKYTDFYWVFASKTPEYANCASYQASKKMIMVGRAKWAEAIKRLAVCVRTNWEFTEAITCLEPVRWDLNWIDNNTEIKLEDLV